VFDVVSKVLAGTTVQSQITVESRTFDSPEAGRAALDAGLGF
jgi:simple sugar transport system substrate-binding protein